MSFANTKPSFRQVSRPIGLKMTLGYLLFFIFNSLLLFAGFYFLFSAALQQKDHEILEDKSAEYALIYNQHGLDSLKNHLNLLRTHPTSGNFFIQIEYPEQQPLLSLLPQHLEFFNAQDFMSEYARHDKSLHWDLVPSKDQEDDIEVITEKLADGAALHVGKSVDDREDLVEKFRKQFFIVFGLTLVLGGLGGALITRRLLKPLRHLIGTVQGIHTGDENLRVPPTSSHDELGQLTLLFNRMLDRLQLSNQSMRQTLDTIAHELRTPLTVVRGQSEFFLQKNETPPEIKNFLETSIESIDQVLTEFKTMTDITEVEVGLQNLKKESFPLLRICEQIVDLYGIVAEQKNIQLRLDCSADIFIFADAKKLRQAIANLVDNAIKYSNDGGLVQILCFTKDNAAFIEVRDQGIGIPENEIPQVLKRLYRGSNSRDQKGLGLGLSLVRSIVQAHEGSIKIQSSRSEGSTFTLQLPVV